MICLAASTKNMRKFTGDVTQAYVQSNTPLGRDVYIVAPKELSMPEEMVLKVVLPLYGIP